jgi:hypothetical protein
MQVLARIHEMFQVELPVRTVFDCPTVAELAQVLNKELSIEFSVAPSTAPQWV